jgi:ABC-type transport system involved in multi-copper enzyme maturation permease subunit
MKDINHFFIFELKFWLRQPIIYIFLLVNALLIFGATTSDYISIGKSFGNVHKNAPFVIMNYYGIMSLIGVIMSAAFYVSAGYRDFQYQFSELLYSKPIQIRGLLIGRFLGATVAASVPLLGISLGNWLGCETGWVDAERIGNTFWAAHFQGFLYFGLLNTLFAGSILFCVAALGRNTVMAFLSSILLIVAYSLSSSFTKDLSNERMGVFLDAFGISAYNVLTKYWTVAEQNNLSLPVGPDFFLNRLLWTVLGFVLLWFTIKKYSIEKKVGGKKEKIQGEKEAPTEISIQHLFKKSAGNIQSEKEGKQLISQIKLELKSLIKSPVFIILLLVSLLNVIPALLTAKDGFGGTTLPITYHMIEIMQGSLYLFLVVMITIFTGSMVWKERDAGLNDIYDALPHSTRIVYIAKLIAHLFLLFSILFITVLASMLIQLVLGYHDLQIMLYAKSVFILNQSYFWMLIFLGFFIHVLVNNKSLGFFLFIIVLVITIFGFSGFQFNHHLFMFGSAPDYTYSDLNGFGPFKSAVLWYKVYWLLFAFLLGVLTVKLWVRGRDTSRKTRWKQFIQTLGWKQSKLFYFLVFVWLISGGWIAYNAYGLNHYVSPKEEKKRQVDYEKNYKKYKGIDQPRITDVHYFIDLYPSERKMKVFGQLVIQNKSKGSIQELHLTLPVEIKIKLDIENATRVHHDSLLGYSIYRFSKAMQSAEKRMISYEGVFEQKGFGNEVAFTQLVNNGSFFNNMDITPQIGYQADREMNSKNERKKQGLGARDRMPKLKPDCGKSCYENYISNHSDWVNVSTLIGTEADQIAVAPGSFKEEKLINGRRYFRYQLDRASVGFYSFMSARYAVKREKFKGIDLEVYYHPTHGYNVDKMMNSMRKSLDYYTTNFGPYFHQQARIIEFPQYADFAQAFPGTMPYSEGIGFIADIEKESDIDMVFYVVAHEMGHQWWAHQVIGANVQGATLLSETFAQYSALMVMEKEFGRDKMQKFLKYEMDKYLNSRGGETMKEVPLMLVEDQGYVHYNKGSVNMYQLKEMIGEDKVNKALQSLIEQYAYREAPYPTSLAAIAAFEKVTPDSLQYVIQDLFKSMTLYKNRIIKAAAKKAGKGFEITMEVTSEKMLADSMGNEKTIPMHDWVELVLYDESENSEMIEKVLVRKKVQLKNGTSVHRLLCDKVPDMAGIDAFHLLIDRMPDDNVREVVVE